MEILTETSISLFEKEHSNSLDDHLREGKGRKRHILSGLLNEDVGYSEPNLGK